MDLQTASANWKKLQNQLKAQDSSKENLFSVTGNPKRRREQAFRSYAEAAPAEAVKRQSRKRAKYDSAVISTAREMQRSNSSATAQKSTPAVPNQKSTDHINNGLSEDVEIGKYVAVDCEMVGVGPQPGLESALARVSLVNYDGLQIYDSFVKPKETVTDWRTHVSGILPKHMTVARDFEDVQKTISNIFQDRILIGHSLSHDLGALLLSHPRRDIRDTARHPPYRRLAGGSSPRLKILASELLGLSIQSGEHSSIEDARACMMLFRRDKAAFEREHARKYPPPKLPPPAENNEVEKQKKPKRKNKRRK